MTRILAIDCGLTSKNPTGVAVIDIGERLHFVYGAALVASKGEWHERVKWLASRIAFECSVWHPDALAWEVPPLMRGNAQTLIKLSHLGGVIIGLASALGIDCYPVQPSEAKQALAGKGNTSKVDMITAAYNRFNITVAKDVADACGVALAGEALLRRRLLIGRST